MAIETTGVENVMEEVAHFWQLRKFQFIEEATDFWMDAVAPKECFGDEDPDLRTALTLNQFFTEWLLFEMPYQESTLVGITALRDEISAEQRDVLKQIAETQRFSSFKMQWLNPDTSMVQLRDVYSGKCYIVESAHLADKRLCARPVIELTTMREYADVHDALKFGSRYVDWKKIVAICDAKGEPTSEATRWRGERWFWKDDWNKNIKLKSGERIKDMQPVICYERGRCDYSVLELTRWYGFDHKSLLNSGKKGIVFDGLTWRLLRYDVDFEKRLKETPLICRETGKTFDTLSDLLDLLEREHECCAYDRPCHMYDLQRAIEGGREYKGFHFEYMVPPSVSGER